MITKPKFVKRAGLWVTTEITRNDKKNIYIRKWFSSLDDVKNGKEYKGV